MRNRLSTSFWFDNWLPFGCLNSYLQGSTSRLGIPATATLASLHHHGNWSLPPARTEQQLALQIHLMTISLTQHHDSYTWEVNGRAMERFSTGSVYTYLKGEVANQPWTKIVWNSYGIPRHNFLTWLLMLNRCPTKDRLVGWGLQVDPVSVLCNSGPEARDHLFFECSFSFQDWERMATRCGFQPTGSWEDTITRLQQLRGDKTKRRLTLLVWQAVLYSIWRERNLCIHQQVIRSVDAILLFLDRLIRNQIQSFRESRPRQASLLMQRWFSSQ